MRKKSFKKECSICEKFYYDDGGKTICTWGKSKTPKILFTQEAGIVKSCNLLDKEGKRDGKENQRKRVENK